MKFIQNQIAMLERQTFKDWECIFVDDGSSDGTPQFLRALCNSNPKYKLLEKTPEGNPARSRNVGIDAAQGTYIALCDHDDYWAPEKLEFQINAFRRFPDAALIHTDRSVMRTTELPKEFPRLILRNEDLTSQPLSQSVLYRCKVTQSSALMPRDLVLRLGKLNPQLRGVDDYHLFIKLALQGKVIRIALPLTYYYWHDKNLSHVQNLFIEGLNMMVQEMKKEALPAFLIRSVEAQALKSEAVANLVAEPSKAFRLVCKSIWRFLLPKAIPLLMLALSCLVLPLKHREKLVGRLKKATSF